MRIGLRNITKSFGANVANDDISLTFEAGRIHALLGENGAGKTTLVRILAGLVRPDSGTILIDDVPLELDSPKAAIGAGIALVSQHPLVSGALTVFENIISARVNQRIGLLDIVSLRREIENIAASCGFDIDLDRPADTIGIGAQKQLEIIRALFAKARVLIFDEPTDVLNPIESERFFALLPNLAAEGRAVVLITHFLKEAIAHSDEISILRKGRVIATLPSRETNPGDLADRMVGPMRPVPESARASSPSRGDIVLDVNRVSIAEGPRTVARDVSFSVRAGEICGIAGVAGNGQEEVVEAVVGLRSLLAGSISILGSKVAAGDTRKLMRADRLGYIPPDRHRQALAGPMSTGDNLNFEIIERSEVSRFGFRLLRAAWRKAVAMVREFEIRPPDVRLPVELLSGGNQQKVVVGRVMSRKPKLLVANNPSRGLDVGATRWVWENIRRVRSEGGAVILLSSDLDELQLLSDRIVVFFRGSVLGELTPDTATAERIGMLMGGAGVSDGVR
jgi:ABC-type uncharacterized transport system ATPase subunit